MIATSIRMLAQKGEDVVAYIASYKDLAMSEMKRTGLPAAIKLAQGIHETEAGKSDLVKKSNNHFGIKCKSAWAGGKVFHDDDARGECFRSYNRPEDSYMDHSDFLKNSQRYAFLFDLDPTDYEGWAFGLKKAGYATNVRYSQVLIRIIKEYNLQDYTLIAMGKLPGSDPLLVSASSMLPSPKKLDKAVFDDPAGETVIEPTYPSGQFIINNTKVIYARANTAWLSIAEQFNIPMSRLWDFNDLENDDDILQKGQLIYLQRKRKVGASEFHIVQNKESLYDICQLEGIRYESLLELNYLKGNMQPATGEKLYLQSNGPSRPVLISEQQNRMKSGSTYAAVGSLTHPQEYTTHLVSTKETLYSISKKYGVDREKIIEWNSLDDMNLKIGQSLIIYQR